MWPGRQGAPETASIPCRQAEYTLSCTHKHTYIYSQSCSETCSHSQSCRHIQGNTDIVVFKKHRDMLGKIHTERHT